ncbi:MAG TPA: hypothetical protein DCL95_14470, partial [Rhodospirillaceae bacterium]|nr:hypothetical protein [Rhodospirillaceae bacterium]
FADQARISRQLVTLVRDVEVPVPLTELKRSVMDKDRLMTFLQDNNFKRLIARVGDGSEKGGAQ